MSLRPEAHAAPQLKAGLELLWQSGFGIMAFSQAHWRDGDRTVVVPYGNKVGPAMQAFYQLPYERFEKWSPAGTPEQIADFLLPYAAAGCRTFNLILNGASVEAEIEAAAEIRDRILAGAA